MLVLLHSICLLLNICASDPVVTTIYGDVKGFLYPRKDGLSSDVFLGIPFASPPIGNLRFEKPMPPTEWTGVLDASEYGPTCYPHNISATLGTPSEDCLRLNVMRPGGTKEGDDLAVLVWIHGGGYEIGSATIYPYQGLSNIYNSQNVIVVSIQYRLGFLGFFSDGDSVPGNYGSWDQAMALRFIHQNIRAFGGDPKKITIWGLSAGGSSASQLSLSPHANKYFQQSISMSGSAFAYWAMNDATVHNSIDLAQAVGCHHRHTMKQCLKLKTIEELYDAMKQIGGTSYTMQFLKFSPRIDGDFYPATPEEMLKDAPSIPSIIGVSRKEGAFFSILARALSIHRLEISQEDYTHFNRTKFKKVIQDLFVVDYFGNDMNAALETVIGEYLDKDEPEAPTSSYYLEKYTKLISDTVFNVAAAREALAKIEKNDPVYLYVTEHFNSVIYPENAPVKGATHVSEYPYIFDTYPLGKFEIKEQADMNLATFFQESWANFVKSGEPTNSVVDWAKADSSSFNYVSLTSAPHQKNGFFVEEVEFWKKMGHEFGKDIIGLRPPVVQPSERVKTEF